MSKKLLFNLSGHPFSDEVAEKLTSYKIVDVEIPNIDLGSVTTLLEGTAAIVDAVVKKEKKAVQTMDYEIVLPGMSILTQVVLVMLHGIGGQFPVVRYMFRTGEGIFDISDALDLQSLRIDMRTARFF